MRTLDTNLIVRLLVGDDLQQTPIAERAFLSAMASGGDLADHLILARASRAGALRMLSFDQRFHGHEGVQLLSADLPSTEPPTVD